MKQPITVTHPHLISDWDHESNTREPENLTKGSEYKAYWKCPLGHKWQSTIANRCLGRGCPKCSHLRNTVPKPGKSLSETNPELISEFLSTENNTSPELVAQASDRNLWWKCSNGHKYQLRVKHRTQGVGCAICAGKTVLVGFNDLASLYPHLVLEWSTRNQRQPYEYTTGSGAKVWWQCTNGHEWETKIHHRTASGSNCPICITSAIERELSIRLGKLYSVTSPATLEVRWPHGNRYVADILVENKVVVEYDGQHWHKSRVAKDLEKSTNMLSTGYIVIRIREGSLPSLEIDDPHYFEISTKWNKTGKEIPGLISDIQTIMKDLSSV